MAKNAKKAVANHGKPITAFFTRNIKAPSTKQDAPTTSASMKDPKAQVSQDSTLPKANLAEQVDSTRKLDPLFSPRKSTRIRASQTPTPSVPLKRSRSPGTPPSSANPSTPRRLNEKVISQRRKSKFDSDSESELNNDVVYVKATRNNPRRKKPRFSSSAAASRSDLSEAVPSSQSDEEVAFKEAASSIQIESLGNSQKQDHPVTPKLDKTDAMAMDTDEDIPGHSWSMSSSPSVAQRNGRTMFTPPSSDLSSMPATPVALDAASKTAKIIADIKARAYAKNLSSPESTALVFNEHLDSSSDEEEILPMVPITTKVVRNPHSSAPLKQRSTRYSLRNRSPTSPTNPPHASTSKVATGKPSTSTQKHKKRSAASDPLAALLKEKSSTERSNGGDDAFSRAEITARQFNKQCLFDDIDLEDDSAIRDPRWLTDKTLTPSLIRAADLKINLGEVDKKQLFGQTGGEVILDILERDKITKKVAESLEKVSGVQFWLESLTVTTRNHSMEVDEDISRYQCPGNSPIIRLLNASLRGNDFSHVAMLLKMDVMSAVDLSERTMLASWLCDFALFAQPNILGGLAADILEKFWSSMNEPLSSSISFTQVLNTIHELGADPSVLAVQNWPVPSSMDIGEVKLSHRATVIRRLIGLVNVCASSRRLDAEEIPDILLALLLLGMDVEASPQLLLGITQAVDRTCRILPEDVKSVNLLVLKLHRCITSYEPINKARFVSILSNGAGLTHRIARSIAHFIITDKKPDQEIPCGLLPLSDVLEQLTPYSRSSGMAPGKFALHEQTDYVDLGFYISILAVAVSNMRGYVVQERQPPKLGSTPSRLESPVKIREKPKSELQLLHLALETLHSNISDTRATHLERSRTKATIKGLSMNVHYQREIWLRNDPHTRSKTLVQYFKPKAKA